MLTGSCTVSGIKNALTLNVPPRPKSGNEEDLLPPYPFLKRGLIVRGSTSHCPTEPLMFLRTTRTGLRPVRGFGAEVRLAICEPVVITSFLDMRSACFDAGS